MRIKKKDGSFNEYALDISYGELVAIENALADNHSGPVADELFAGLKWYLDGNVEKPGEEEEDKAEAKEDTADLDADLSPPPEGDDADTGASPDADYFGAEGDDYAPEEGEEGAAITNAELDAELPAP